MKEVPVKRRRKKSPPKRIGSGGIKVQFHTMRKKKLVKEIFRRKTKKPEKKGRKRTNLRSEKEIQKKC